VTGGSVAGLFALNVVLLGAGATLLWGLRGWHSWSDLVRLAGVSYLVGVSSVSIPLSLAIVVGLPFGPATMAVAMAAVAATGLTVGLLQGNARPRGFRMGPPTVVTAAVTAALVVYFEVLFRSSRIAFFNELDSWWVWTIRAKALYFFGDLGGDELVRVGETWDRTYPPAVPLLQAQAFEAMGSADAVTLHLQQWFLALGFAGALVGLLWGRVRPSILLPSVLLVLVLPGFTERVTWVTADTLVAYLASIAAVQLYLWIEDGHGWRLWSSALLLAGVALTKREGLIVIVIVVAAAFVTSYPQRRRTWPRLAVAGALAVALSASWRFGLASRGVGDGPTEGFLGFLDDPGRGLDAVELILLSLIDPTWLGFVVLVAVAATVAFTLGIRAPVVFATTLAVLFALAWTYVMWVETRFEITRDPGLTPVIRLALVTLFTLAPFLPLLLEDAWRATTPEGSASGGRSRLAHLNRPRAAVTWTIVAVAAVCYPLAVLLAG
jgi:hypothetical protein